MLLNIDKYPTSKWIHHKIQEEGFNLLFGRHEAGFDVNKCVPLLNEVGGV